jgi:uncharacterized protein (TIGR00299 family) protein
MKILYFDCFAGIAGDMALGAFLDLGLPLDHLKKELHKLPLGKFRISVKEVKRGGIRAKKVEIISGSKPEKERSHHEIQKLIRQSQLSPGAKDLSRKLFQTLAEVEARIHGTSPEQVHFHEIGALDSIMDLVGVAVAKEYFHPDRILSSALPLGKGFVDCAHGRLPLPAPATLELLQGIPVTSFPAEEETVTPTGAVIIRVLASGFSRYPEMKIDRVGYGAGSRESRSGIPNLLRLVLGRDVHDWKAETVCLMESTVDDMNPEIYAGLREELETAGALEVYFTPIQAKKDRPGVLVRVLCEDSDRERVAEAFFRGSSTSGVRFQQMERYCLPRSQEVCKTPWGPVRVKRVEGKGREPWRHPEYEDLKNIAKKEKVTLFAAEKMVKEFIGRGSK